MCRLYNKSYWACSPIYTSMGGAPLTACANTLQCLSFVKNLHVPPPPPYKRALHPTLSSL